MVLMTAKCDIILFILLCERVCHMTQETSVGQAQTGGGGGQPGGAHQGLGDLNGEKSNNCIRPEGGRAFQGGQRPVITIASFPLSLLFHGLILGRGGNLRKGGVDEEGAVGEGVGYGLSSAVKLCPCNQLSISSGDNARALGRDALFNALLIS